MMILKKQGKPGYVIGVLIGRVSPRLIEAMHEEFERNGRRPLSAGKVRISEAVYSPTPMMVRIVMVWLIVERTLGAFISNWN